MQYDAAKQNSPESYRERIRHSSSHFCSPQNLDAFALAVFWSEGSSEGSHVPAYTLKCDDFNAGVPLYTMRADLGATDATHRWENAAGVFFNGETGTVYMYFML